MEVTKTDRGFQTIIHESYPTSRPMRLLQQSSAIGDYEDAMSRPGSSFLWVAGEYHLSREEVSELVQHLQSWLETGKLSAQTPPPHGS